NGTLDCSTFGRPPASNRRGHCQKRSRHAMAQLPGPYATFRFVINVQEAPKPVAAVERQQNLGAARPKGRARIAELWSGRTRELNRGQWAWPPQLMGTSQNLKAPGCRTSTARGGASVAPTCPSVALSSSTKQVDHMAEPCLSRGHRGPSERLAGEDRGRRQSA